MAVITYKNVNAPSFTSPNALTSNATAGLIDVLRNGNIFKQISQDRADTAVLAREKEQDAFDRETALLDRRLTGQQLDQGVQDLQAGALGIEASQFDALNRGDLLADKRSQTAADIKRIEAAARSSNVNSSLNTLLKDEKQQEIDRADQLRRAKQALTNNRLSLGNDVFDPADVRQQNANIIQQFGNDPELIAFSNTLENQLTDPTNAEATAIKETEKLRLESRADAQDTAERANKLAVANAKRTSKTNNINLDNLIETVTDTVGFDFDSDTSSQSRFVNAVVSKQGQGISNTRLKALAAEYISTDGTFDENGFKTAADDLLISAN